MSDISTLETRITAALDRIRAGIETAKPVPQSDGLEDRLADLKARQDSEVAALTARIETYQDQMQKLDAELQKLRASNDELRQMNAALRAAVTDGVSAADYDKALQAEVEAVAAQRSADAAEIDAILAELKPLITEAAHATT